MATLSLVGAQLLRKYKAHACTDVTGFGILGHAHYLAQAQKKNVKFII
jgi:selenide,water dikinase